MVPVVGKVHLFGAASSPGCVNYGMWYLACQNERVSHSSQFYLKNNFYIDDGLINFHIRVENVDTVIKLVQEAQNVCAKWKLRLHKFIPKNKKVMESIPVSKRANGV